MTKGIIAAAIALFALNTILPSSFIEKVYSRHVYIFIVNVVSAITSIFPFTLTYFSLCLIPVALILALVAGRKKSWRVGLLWMASAGGLIYSLFLILWGFNYHRVPLISVLAIPEVVSNEKRLELLKEYALSTNQLREQSPRVGCLDARGDYSALDKKIFPFEKDLLSKFGYPAPRYVPIKSSWILGPLLLRIGNSGIYGLYTAEPNVTNPVAPGALPFVMAHERAHHFGFASETEASVVAFLTLSTIPDPELQYSGRLAFWGTLSKEDQKLLSKEVLADLQCHRDFWAKYAGFADKITHFFYDYYLKSQGQSGGMRTYADASEVLIRYLAQTKN